jgi:hypothetical protein
MASEIKTNKLNTFDDGKVVLVTTLEIGSGGHIDCVSGAGDMDFGTANSVTFPINSITGNAISGGSADCDLAHSGSTKLAPSAAGVVVTGTITGATTITGVTVNGSTEVQENGVGVLKYAPYAWGSFTFTIAIATNVPTVATLAERTTGSSAGFNVGTSAAATKKITLYYTAGAVARCTKAMVNFQLNGLAANAKLLDYTVTMQTDRIEIDFLPLQSGIGDVAATTIEGNIIVMVPTS